MKTQEQNTKEVMTYLQKSAQNFFQSEDGRHWQAVVKIHELDKYVFIKDGQVIKLNLANYVGGNITAGKTFLKQKLHPVFDSTSPYFKANYGHGPAKKMRAVRWNLARLELTAAAVKEYLDSKTEKGSV